jgi:Flp pilus assembly protein TadG
MGLARWKRGGVGQGSGRSRGQALVEFAIILPVFLMVGFGIFDFGLAFDASIGVSNAAREGARLGATQPNTSAITTRVRDVAGRLDNANLSVTVSCKTSGGGACPGGVGGATPGGSIIVSVTYDYPMLTPIAFGTRIPLTSTAEMRVE